jgi:hypothetical protein
MAHCDRMSHLEQWAVMFPDLDTDLGDFCCSHHKDRISLVLVLSPFLPVDQASFRGLIPWLGEYFFPADCKRVGAQSHNAGMHVRPNQPFLHCL